MAAKVYNATNVEFRVDGKPITFWPRTKMTNIDPKTTAKWDEAFRNLKVPCPRCNKGDLIITSACDSTTLTYNVFFHCSGTCPPVKVSVTFAEMASLTSDRLAFAELVSNKYTEACKDSEGVVVMQRRKEEAPW